MNIVFLGPPGCGKGTQAKRVVEKFGIAALSTGDIFRETAASGSDLGKKLKSYMEVGQLVPDDLVSHVVFEKLKTMLGSEGFLLDGFPRTMPQAKGLDQFLETEKATLELIFYFHVSTDELVRRLSARRQCPSCKTVYNLDTNPPKQGHVCDNDSTTLTQRPDDVPEVIKKRLTIYEEDTAPVLRYYTSRPGFHKINASQTIDRVFNEISAAISATNGSSIPSGTENQG